MSGKAPVLDLDQAIRDAYRNDPKLANGRLSNAQVVDLLDDDSIVAVCRRGHHRQTVPVLNLPLPNQPPKGAEWIEAYRRWKR